MLPKCVLASPASGSRLQWREIVKVVKARLQRWSEDDFGSLWSDALKCGHSLSARKDYSPGSARSSNIRRAKTTVQNGLLWKRLPLRGSR